MAKYLTSQIIAGRLTYAQVMASKWKKCKRDIDKELARRGYTINEDGEPVKIED